MTAAYDDDTILSSRNRRDNLNESCSNNYDLPINAICSELENKNQITSFLLNFQDKSKSSSDEMNINNEVTAAAATVNVKVNQLTTMQSENNHQNSNDELLLTKNIILVSKNSSQSKTVNSNLIKIRDNDDENDDDNDDDDDEESRQENVAVNKDEENFTSYERRNSLETCLMLRKQKNFTDQEAVEEKKREKETKKTKKKEEKEEETKEEEEEEEETKKTKTKKKEEEEEEKKKIIINSYTQEIFNDNKRNSTAVVVVVDDDYKDYEIKGVSRKIDKNNKTINDNNDNKKETTIIIKTDKTNNINKFLNKELINNCSFKFDNNLSSSNDDKSKIYTQLVDNNNKMELVASYNNLISQDITNKDFNYNLTDENKSKEILLSNKNDDEDEGSSSFSSNLNEEDKNLGSAVDKKLTKLNNGSSFLGGKRGEDSRINGTDFKCRMDIFEKGKRGIFDNESMLDCDDDDEEEGGDVSNSEEDYDPGCEISFHEAIRLGDARSVETLMERGAVQNIDEPDWNVSGDPPLLVAATNHSLPVLRALLTNGCDPGVRSPRGETALHRAIINGSPSSVYEIVEELLNHDCPSTVKEAGGGLTALHVLTRQLAHAQSSKSLQHNFDIALKTLALLAKVGPVDAKDHQGRSALHLLASSSTFGNSHRIEIEPMIQTLLEAGADPALKNDRGETPLHEALECGALNTAFLLIPHTPVGITSRYGETPLHIAARKNQTEVAESLLNRGEDPSFQDAGGNTPLHLASARGFHRTVSLLVTSPLAQLEKTNDDGLTSLQVAAESGFVNAVKILLKAGADPSQSARYCVTTLHRHPDISVLIDHELTRRRQLAA